MSRSLIYAGVAALVFFGVVVPAAKELFEIALQKRKARQGLKRVGLKL